MEQNVEINSSNTIGEKKEKYKWNYIFYSLILLSFLIFSNIVLVFKPLYNNVYYGQANPLFHYGLMTLLLIALYVVARKVIKKKFNITYKKDDTPLSWKRTLIVFFSTFIVIFIISASIGFNVKIFYDLGKSTTGFKIIIHVVKLLYYIMAVLYFLDIIGNLEHFFDDVIKMKNENIRRLLPFGGIIVSIIYLILALIENTLKETSIPLVFGLNTPLWLYILLPIVFGELYLLTNRNFLKAYGASLLIFLF